MKRVDDPFTCLGCNVFEDLIDCPCSLVENLLCLLNLSGSVLQTLVCFSKILFEFFDASFGIPNFGLDLLFRLLMANQRFVLGLDDVVKIVQPRLGSSELFILKLHPMTDQEVH